MSPLNTQIEAVVQKALETPGIDSKGMGYATY
jgi:hypothetical protein